MIAVLTGDIIKSRTRASSEWQSLLKEVLQQYGQEPNDWELFRGDSFQLALAPEEAFWASIHIKASIKQIPKLDVRIGIGIGEQDFKAPKITEATGTAYIRSGECFDQLKKQSLGIATGNTMFDETFNTMIAMATIVMNNWSDTVAKVILSSVENPEKSQKEIADLLKKSQSSISEALKRGGFEEVKQIESFYRKQLARL